jgi:hypothetical protein
MLSSTYLRKCCKDRKPNEKRQELTIRPIPILITCTEKLSLEIPPPIQSKKSISISQRHDPLLGDDSMFPFLQRRIQDPVIDEVDSKKVTINKRLKDLGDKEILKEKEVTTLSKVRI